MGDERQGWRRWPGVDGLVLITLGGLLLAVFLGRGLLGGGVLVAALLTLDALWLGITWLTRRQVRAP